MNAYILILKKKGMDISKRFDLLQRRIKHGDTITDRYGVEYIVENVVYDQKKPDETIYLHLSCEKLPEAFPHDDVR